MQVAAAEIALEITPDACDERSGNGSLDSRSEELLGHALARDGDSCARREGRLNRS